MNGMCKIFVYSLIIFLCAASSGFSANTTEANKETVEQKTSDQSKAVLKQENSEQKNETSKQAVSAKNQDSSKAPSVFFPEPKFEFDSEVDGAELVHDFIIMNKGTDTLEVQKVKTG
ncbi:MAG: hypothetical protein HQK62_03515 [Desulfamplus sp.]|nr:hypothetical protein [Desulfamplus sp.]